MESQWTEESLDGESMTEELLDGESDGRVGAMTALAVEQIEPDTQ